jgi:hypothetical protein
MTTIDPARALVTLLQLGRRARAANTPEELAFIMVNESLQLLEYRQASLWLTGNFGRVAAVSGVPEPDANAPYVQWLGHVFRHQLRQENSQQLHSLHATHLSDTLATDWASWLPTQGLWLPLVVKENIIGVLLLARENPWSDAEQALAKEMQDAYAHALASHVRQVQHRRLWQEFKHKKWLWIGFVITCFFPVRMSVLAPAEVIPLNPFLVRAPLDGVVDKFSVVPNQTVVAGDALFNLDTSVLKSHHALAQQAYNTAQEEFRQSAQLAVTDDKGKLEMALRRGALAEKSVELEYTANQLQRVQVKAERAGIAVFADVNDWLGKAVVIGERILLIADPQQVELRIDLPANDIIPIEPGASVNLYPNASPISSYTARVKSVSYQAEPTTSGILAYRVKAELDAEDQLPRIGLMGTAKISGNRVPLIYYLFRKPISAARQWLGW